MFCSSVYNIKPCSVEACRLKCPFFYISTFYTVEENYVTAFKCPFPLGQLAQAVSPHIINKSSLYVCALVFWGFVIVMTIIYFGCLISCFYFVLNHSSKPLAYRTEYNISDIPKETQIRISVGITFYLVLFVAGLPLLL